MFYKLIFCLRDIRNFFFFAVGKLLFFPTFSFFLGPMHIQEARNNVLQINILLAGNSEKNIFRCRQIIIFFQPYSYFKGLCRSRKPEIMFSKLFVCLRENRKKKYVSLSANYFSSFFSYFMDICIAS